MRGGGGEGGGGEGGGRRRRRGGGGGVVFPAWGGQELAGKGPAEENYIDMGHLHTGRQLVNGGHS
jgi:hypothetical protein